MQGKCYYADEFLRYKGYHPEGMWSRLVGKNLDFIFVVMM